MLRPLLLALVVVALSARPDPATSLSFECLSTSSKCAVGEEQLSVDLSSGSPGQVSFLLSNDGDEELAVSQLFFDDGGGVLGDLLSATGATGVDFLEGGKPDNLKGGKKIDFFADSWVTAVKPAKNNAVNPGEELLITFELADGTTLDDVLAALESGDLRIGLNAKKAYVSTSSVVPEPGALALLALGAAVWSARRRRS